MVEVKIEGAAGIIETLNSLPPEVVSKRGGPVRAALAKGARVMRDAAKANFRAAVALPGKTGVTDSTGFTEDQIIVKRVRMKWIKGEKYIITVRPKPHPSGNLLKSAKPYKRALKKTTKDRAIRANDIAFIMEYGSANQPATPWLRPTFQAKAPEIINIVTADLLRRVNRIVRKLAQQNKGLG